MAHTAQTGEIAEAMVDIASNLTMLPEPVPTTETDEGPKVYDAPTKDASPEQMPWLERGGYVPESKMPFTGQVVKVIRAGNRG